MAGFDEDEPKEFERERNLIIPTGDSYIKIPMPLGFHLLPNIGRVLAEIAMYGKPSERMAQLLMTTLETFNPIGTGASLAQTISPTVFDPIVALSENKDWTGMKIYREDFSALDPTPGFTRKKDSASALSTAIAEVLNTITGGGNYTPGVFSPTPDQIDYLIGQAFGGVGREVVKGLSFADSITNDEELPAYKIPLFGRLYGSVGGESGTRDKYYENIKTMNVHDNEIKGRIKDGESTLDYFREHPEARLRKIVQKTERRIADIRKRHREAKAQGDTATATRLNNLIQINMRAMNERIEKAQ
jgi:hypothetical protein